MVLYMGELDERYPLPEHATIMSMSSLSDARKVALRVQIELRKGLTASYLGITAHFPPEVTCSKSTSPYQFQPFSYT